MHPKRIILTAVLLAAFAGSSTAHAANYQCAEAKDLDGKQTVTYKNLDLAVPTYSHIMDGDKYRRVSLHRWGCELALSIAEMASNPQEVDLSFRTTSGRYQCFEEVEEGYEDVGYVPVFFVCRVNGHDANTVSFTATVGY